MSTILSVSVASSFSASPIDAAAPVPEELDPRFVEELQGALGRQEPPGTPQAAAGDTLSPDSVDATSEIASGLQNLPLIPWITLPTPANFAPTALTSTASTDEPVAVDGVVSATAPALSLPTYQTSNPVKASEAVSGGRTAPADPAVGAEVVNTLPLASTPRAQETGALEKGVQSTITAAASDPLPLTTDITEVMNPNPAIHVTGGTAVSHADQTVEPTPSLTQASAELSDAVSAPQVGPLGHSAKVTTATSPSMGATQAPPGSTATTAVLTQRDEGRYLAAQRSEQVLSDVQAQLSTQVQQSAVVQGINQGDTTTLDSLSIAQLRGVSTDFAATAPSDLVTSAVTQSTTVVDPSLDGTPIRIAAQVIRVAEADDAAASLGGDSVTGDASSLSATLSVEESVPAVATPAQVITASARALTLEVTAQVLENTADEPVRVSSRRADRESAADPLTELSIDVEAKAVTSSQGAGLMDATASGPDDQASDDQTAAVSTQASVAAVQAQIRTDPSTKELRADASLVVVASDRAQTRVSSTETLETWRADATQTTTQDLSSAESTFASSFVRALMGQSHHANAQVSQSLEVVPSPAPMAPHEVRLDAGQVQVEVVRLVKQGGGQVVMELTPPDESKFKIDLTISQQGVARLVVDGASESTRLRLEQTVSGLQDQFQQMGLQLQLDMRQPHQQEARSQSPDMTPDKSDNGLQVSATLAEPAPSLNGRPTWEQGQVYLVA